MTFLQLMDALASAFNLAAGVAMAICAMIAWCAMGRRTRHCFRFAYGLLGVGGLALVAFEVREPLAAFFGVETSTGELWEYYAHTALFVGFAVYLVLDRRRIRPQQAVAVQEIQVGQVVRLTSVGEALAAEDQRASLMGVERRRSERRQEAGSTVLGLVVGIALALVLVLGMARWARAQQLDLEECAPLAQIISTAVVYRDLEANVDKVVAMLRSQLTDLTPDRRSLIERELRRAYAGTDNRVGVFREVLNRCKRQGGNMGAPA